MDCQDVNKFLQLYLDGELDEVDRQILEDHLSTCSSCRHKVTYERRFLRAVQARISLPVARPEFRTQVADAMASAGRRRTLPRRLVWGSVPAAAALGAVVIFTWAVTSGFSPLVEEAVQQHSSAPPVEVNTTESSEIEDWFKAKVDFNVALPRFRNHQLGLVGARLSHLARRRAALVRYRQGGHDFTLFVVTDPGGSLGGQQCRRVRSREICLAEQKGYTVVLWRSRGLAYSLVGDSSPHELMEVLSSAISF